MSLLEKRTLEMQMKWMTIRLLLLVGCLCPATMAQTSFYSNQATQAVSIIGSPQPVQGPIPFAGVRVCNLPLTQTAPCLPLATITDSSGNTLSNSIGSNFGQFTSDSFGRFTFGCTTGANLRLQWSGASNTPQGDIPITCPGSGLQLGGNNTFTGNNTHSGTETFSGAVVASAIGPSAAQQHTLPAVTSDTISLLAASQTFTNKNGCLTAQCIPVLVYSTASASTTGSIGTTTMATAGGSGNTYRFSAYGSQTVLGASCAGSTSLTVNLTFTDPGGAGSNTHQVPIATAASTAITSNYVISNNGTVDFLPTTSGGLPSAIPTTFRAKAGTVVQYSTTYTPAGGCSPAPGYQVYPILEQLN